MTGSGSKILIRIVWLAYMISGAGGMGMLFAESLFEETGLPPFRDIPRFTLSIGGGVNFAFFDSSGTAAPNVILHRASEEIDTYGTSTAAHFFGITLAGMPLYMLKDWLGIGGELAFVNSSSGYKISAYRIPIRAAVHFNIADIIQITPLVGTTIMIDDPQVGTVPLFDIGIRFDFWKIVTLHASYLLGKTNGLAFGSGGGLYLF